MNTMNFTQFLLILKARRWIILGVLFFTVGLTAAYSLLQTKEYTATTTLVIDSKSKDPFTGQLLPSQLFPGYMATQVDIIQSENVAMKAVDELKLADNPATREAFVQATEGQGSIRQWLAGALLPKLQVEPAKESSLISISFSGANPQFAAMVANAFAKAYINTSLELRVAPAKQTADWFDQQITQLRQNLDQAQQKLTAYQREKGIVESDERLDVETRRMSELGGQIVAAQSSSYDASSRVRDSSSLPEVINNPVVQGLKAQVAQAEGKLADLGKRVGTNHPDFLRLQAELESYRTKLAAELNTATRGVNANAGAARERVGGLMSAFEHQKARVLELKKQREEAALLARDVENAQRIYDSALQRYGQSRMEAQSTQTDITVLNPASAPTEPSKPRVFLNILISLFIGVMLGVVSGFLAELLDRRVRSGQDLLGLEIPVLAEVTKKAPMIDGIRGLFRRHRPASV